MKKKDEIDNSDLKDTLSDMVDLPPAQIEELLSLLDIDQLINLQAAVDEGDIESVQDILDQVTVEESPQLNAQEILKEINRKGKKLLAQDESLAPLWPIIGQCSLDDWNLLWPAINMKLLAHLYQLAQDDKKAPLPDKITKSQAHDIWNYAQSQVNENYVIYKNQLCEVLIAHGPNHTMGINWQGQTRMVNKHQTKKLHEHVLGMTHMPSLARMRILAGMGDAYNSQNNSVKEDHLSPPQNLIVHLDLEHPHQTRVRIPNTDGTITVEGLELRIRRLGRELQTQLSKNLYDHAQDTCNRLKDSLHAMVTTLSYLDTQQQSPLTNSEIGQ